MIVVAKIPDNPAKGGWVLYTASASVTFAKRNTEQPRAKASKGASAGVDLKSEPSARKHKTSSSTRQTPRVNVRARSDLTDDLVRRRSRRPSASLLPSPFSALGRNG